MNSDLMKVVLLGVGAVVVWYLVTNTMMANAVPNDGALVVPVNAMEMQSPASSLNAELHTGEGGDGIFRRPIPGSPESVFGAGVDRTRWDGISENVLQGALSKQYQELTADDLLPFNDMAHWADVYPNGVGQLQNKNFLHAGHHVGINTVGQSLRNANLQLRSEPPNPQVLVSPWSNSSISAELLRRPLEIAGCEDYEY